MRAFGQASDQPEENAIFETARATIRVLFATYVMAAGAAILIDPALPAPLGGMFGAEAAPFAAATLLVTGGALMVGMMVRPASMILAFYLLLSGIAHLGMAGVPGTPGAVGGDLTLLSTVLLILLSDTAHERRPGISPRRVRPVPIGPLAEPPASRRLDRSSEEAARHAVEVIARREAKAMAEKRAARTAAPALEAERAA